MVAGSPELPSITCHARLSRFILCGVFSIRDPMTKRFTAFVSVLLISFSIGFAAPAASASVLHDTPVATAVGSLPPKTCDISSNLDTTANVYISACRKASIRKVFPGEYLGVVLLKIKRDRTATGKKAWKLLNDQRWRK
ncbi:hypothetical protein [Nonomuraea jabiensis]|uniref:hypothetical protein n=1 Tax=Nonomuraea jabiensis TaxID=882448 RepID=UPI00368B6732